MRLQPQTLDTKRFYGTQRTPVGSVFGAVSLCFLGDRLYNGSPYAIRPLCLLSCSVLSVCLSVTLVYCGQTDGWINVKLGVQVGLGPGYIVLDGDQAALPQRDTAPTIFGPYLLWLNGWMD